MEAVDAKVGLPEMLTVLSVIEMSPPEPAVKDP